ncbi:hypothetical protein [Streptomyces sp. NPDC007856]|uniref:hypothetical protein n=1 Tax=Streptomyces sp. NPDC007856 TaxID=3364781 RepID=UPI0036A2D012
MNPGLNRLTELLPRPTAPEQTPGCPNDVYDQLETSAERDEGNEWLWRYEDKPAELEDDSARLICWATTDNGEYLYWLVPPGDDPDSRTIMINDESGEDWERYYMTVTRFLTAVLSGEIHSEILWHKCPLPQPEFRPARDIQNVSPGRK